jgi:LysM repeat protein
MAARRYGSANAAEGAVRRTAPPKAPTATKKTTSTPAGRTTSRPRTSTTPPPAAPRYASNQYGSAAAAEGRQGAYLNQYAPGDVAPGRYGGGGVVPDQIQNYQMQGDGSWRQVGNTPTTGQRAAQAATQMGRPPAAPPAPPAVSQVRVSNQQQAQQPRSSYPSDPMAAANAINYTQPGFQGYTPPPAAPIPQVRVSNYQYGQPRPQGTTSTPTAQPNSTLPNGTGDWQNPTPSTGQGTPTWNSPAPSGGGSSGGGGGGGGYNPNTQPSGGSNGGTYIVQAGDSLAKIAQQLGISYQELLALNPMANPNLIYPGQELILPGGGGGDQMSGGMSEGNWGAPMDPNDPKDPAWQGGDKGGGNWSDPGYGDPGYGGGDQGSAEAPAAPAPAAPTPPPAPPAITPNWLGFNNMVASLPPGGILDVPPLLQQALGQSAGWFDQLLRHLGFQPLGDIGVNGVNSDYVRPATLRMTPDALWYLNAMPPQVRALFEPFVAQLGAMTPTGMAPTPPARPSVPDNGPVPGTGPVFGPPRFGG